MDRTEVYRQGYKLLSLRFQFESLNSLSVKDLMEQMQQGISDSTQKASPLVKFAL